MQNGEPKLITFESTRKFGTETEVLSYDKRDFQRHPLESKRELPQGLDDIAHHMSKMLHSEVQCNKWHQTHNNDTWVLKPDRSCGMEICSPVYKGWHGLNRILMVTDMLAANPKVAVDSRCGFHVHIDVGDLSPDELLSVLTFWVKFEPVFLDSMPFNRKINRYCQLIGASPAFDHEANPTLNFLTEKLGRVKYYSLNTYHMYSGKRSTIEFRIAEGDACVDSFFIKNWCRMVLHFVERSRQHRAKRYSPKDPWSGYVWLDLNDLMKFMGYYEPNISKGVEQARNWFLARIKHNMNCDLVGVFSPEARQITKMQVEENWQRFGLGDYKELLCPANMKESLYSPELRF